MFTGGRLTHSALSQLRSQGTLDFSGSAMPDEHDLVRVYYQMEDERGEAGTFALGTYFCSIGSPDYDGPMVSGQRRPRIDAAPRGQGEVRPLLHGEGRDQRGRARRRHLQAPRPAHERAALRLRPAEGRGVRTGRQLADYSQRPPRHGPGSPRPTRTPTALSRWSRTSSRRRAPPVRVFNDGSDSIMLPRVSRSDNADDIPNAVYLTYETEEESLWAVCRNTDPNSRASIPYRGYEVPLVDR